MKPLLDKYKSIFGFTEKWMTIGGNGKEHDENIKENNVNFFCEITFSNSA